MLKIYVRHGMIVSKIHEIVSFKQCEWFEKYIDINTQKRKKAKNEIEKYIYKLLNNSFTVKPWNMYEIVSD